MLPIHLPTARRSGLLGLLVGDAYGVPYEFHEPLPVEEVRLPPPPAFPRAHRHAPACAWSDDGAQALALLDALTFAPAGVTSFVPAFARGLVRWHGQGAYAVDGRVFDVGAHTSAVLAPLAAGRAELAAEVAARPDAYGNGSLMRVLPCALVAETDDEAAAWARASSAVTHDSVMCRESCALYVCVARALLDNVPGPAAWLHGCARYARTGGLDPGKLIVGDDEARKATGFVLHGLNLARIALTVDLDFEVSLRQTIALGGDTDSNAAIVGGLLGIRDKRVPEHLLARLPSPDWLHRLVERLS